MDDKYFSLKHRFMLGGAVSLFLTFSLVFFGPLNLYIADNDKFWFGFFSMLVPVSVAFVVSFVLSTLVCSLPKSAIHKALCCLVFGLALGFCIQGNFFNIKYGSGVLDGSKIVWEDYTTYGAIDSAMWAACLALPFAFIMVFKKQWRKILIYTSLTLIIVQGIALAVTVVKNSDVINKTSYEVTTDGMYELSNQKNTVVFILDSFDQKYFEDFKEDHPDYEEKLDCFTEYTNALASGASKIEALPSMLSGTAYKKESRYSSYIDNIWDGDTAYLTLKNNDVDSRIFAESTFFGRGATESVENIVSQAENFTAYKAMTKVIYQYTLYTYMPHYLKMPFWPDANLFNNYKSENTYTSSDAKFYEDYKNKEGFTYTDKYDKSLRIYSLEGAEAPYTLTEDAQKDENGTDLYEQINGCFTYLFDMIDNMKENGVFDKSTIIITANHGDTELMQHPVLLIKKASAKHGYKTSSAPVSHFDLPATLVKTLTDAPYSEYGSGKAYYDIKEKESRERDFFLNAGANKDTRVEQYRLKTSADKYKNMELMDCFYTNNGVVEKYKLGTLLSFDMDTTANLYTTEGFMHTTGWRTPMAGPRGQMVIPISNIPKDAIDLHVFFGVESVDKPTTCTIEANGRQIFKEEIDSSLESTGLNVLVPTKIMPTNRTLTLDFYFDDIDESEMEEDVNDRTMTISFNSFKIYTQ
ncbi:MAG: hypothetical protein KBS62_01450 [Oscillospiraceae bacterium]|nr:hypothetical protein [Candidatus Ruminococcus equi]